MYGKTYIIGRTSGKNDFDHIFAACSRYTWPRIDKQRQHIIVGPRIFRLIAILLKAVSSCHFQRQVIHC
jgi:hypothetical protein